MPQIAFVGDTHGEISRMYAAIEGWQARTGVVVTAIVQVGDFGVLAALDWPRYWSGETKAPIPTYVIMGNHEDPELIRAWQKAPDKVPNIALLPDGGITDICGVRVGTVWGNFSPRSWLYPERVKTARYAPFSSARIAMHINREAVDRLLACPSPMDVLVTHDAASNTIPPGFSVQPSPELKGILGLDPDERTSGCPGFKEVLGQFEPPHYFFGHFHTYWDSVIGGTRVTCLSALGFSNVVGNWCKVIHFPDKVSE